jgi:hypothetical protein
MQAEVKFFRRKEMYFCNKSRIRICSHKTIPVNSSNAGRKGKIFRDFFPGLTLLELVITMAAALIVVLAAAVLLVSGHRVWKQGYYSAHKKIKEEAQAIFVTFGSVARKSNRLNYVVYDQVGGNFMPVAPVHMNDTEVLGGDAVEFRYWDVDLDATDSHHLIDTTKTATAYALFYLDHDDLAVDYGPYPPGGVPAGGGHRNTANIKTVILAHNDVSTDGLGYFSHTVDSGVGNGCVRTNILLTDPNDNEQIRIITGSMIRNIWPR